MTSITAWRKFATHRLFFLFLAGIFGLGIVMYFGSGPSSRGADRNVAPQNNAIATVNGEPITQAEYNATWDRYRQMMGGMDPNSASAAPTQGEVLSQLINTAIERSIARQAGVRVSDAEVDKTIDDLRKQMSTKDSPASDDDLLQITKSSSMDELRDNIRRDLVNRDYEQSLGSAQKVTEDDLLKSFDKAKLRHILIASMDSKTPTPGALPDAQARNRADEILAQLKAGGDFAKLANEYSMDPSNKKPIYDAKAKKTREVPQGGELGMQPLSKYVPEFADAARALKPGQISGVVKTPFGYHIIKMEQYQRDLPADYAKNKADLLTGLRQQKIRGPLQEKIAAARKTAKIVWKDPSLQWRYDLSQMYANLQPGQDTGKGQDAIIAELRAEVKRNSDDSAAALTLAQMLYSSKYNPPKVSLPGRPAAPAPTGAERDKLRTEIIECYKQALKHTSGMEDQQTRFQLAELYTEAGQKDKALDEYKRIQRMLSWDTDKPDAKWAHQRLLGAFQKLGATDLAMQEQKSIDAITVEELRQAAVRKAEQEKEAAAKKAADEKLAAERKAQGNKPAANKPGEPGASKPDQSGAVTVPPGGNITVTPTPAPGAGQSAPKPSTSAPKGP